MLELECSAGRQRLPAADPALRAVCPGALGLGGIERYKRRVRNSLCQGHLVAGSLEERDADHDAVADDERG